MKRSCVSLLALCLAAAAQLSAQVPRSEVKLAIIAYHEILSEPQASSDGYSVPLATFKAQVQAFLDSGWTFVSLSQIRDFYRGGASLPARSVHITFDDGYKGTLTLAHPWLRSKGIPYSIYPYVNMINSGRRSALTWADLKQLAAEGAEIGCHSYSHPILTRPDPAVAAKPEAYQAWLVRETAGAKAAIEAGTGVSVYAYAYPFGMADGASLAAVKKAGFDLSLNILGGDNGGTTDPYGLCRILVLPTYEGYELVGRASIKPLPVRILQPDVYSVLPGGKGSFRVEMAPEDLARFPSLRLRMTMGPAGTGPLGDFKPAGDGIFTLDAVLPKPGWYVLEVVGDGGSGGRAVSLMLCKRPAD